jgi:hypothetical protein
MNLNEYQFAQAGGTLDEYEQRVREHWAAVNVEFHNDDNDVTVPTSVLDQTPKRVTFQPTDVLHTRQWSIENEHLPVAAKNRDPITVVDVDGEPTVFDGNHRLLARRLQNKPVSANVYPYHR